MLNWSCDIVLLTSGKMFTDKRINAAQKLLVEEFSIFEKFQNPLLSQMNLFRSIHPKQNQFNYIMSAATTECYPRQLFGCVTCVEVFDSVYSDISSDTSTQISTMYQSFALMYQLLCLRHRSYFLPEAEWFGSLWSLRDCLGL